MDNPTNTNNPCSLWSSFLTIGIFLVILGTLALSSAFFTTLATVFFLGLLLFAGGVSYIIHSFWTPDWKNFFIQFFLGALSAVAGWLMVLNPATGAVSLTLLLGSFFIASGIFKTFAALSTHLEHKGWFIFNGVITLLLGILVLLQWPASSLWIIGLFIGIDLIFGGWTNIMYGLMLRKRCSLEPNRESISIPQP